MVTRRVLVVDDDEDIQETLKTGLETLGYKIFIAADESAVHKILSEMRPDAILMDVSIPGIDGISLCREIHLMPGFSDVPILIITAYSDKKTYHDAFLFGAIDYLIKPFDILEVKNKIEAAIEKLEKRKGEKLL